MKLSIIMPIYNMERYVRECLDELTGIEGLEVIMVNDESKDSTKEILKEYSDKYKNFTLINQKNAGPVVARQNGFKHSKADDLLFMDPDDMITREGIQEIIRNITKEKTVIWKTQTIDENSNICPDYYPTPKLVDSLSFVLTNRYATWLRTLKKDFVKQCIKNDTFDELFMSCSSYEKYPEIKIIDKKIHQYRLRRDSLTRVAFNTPIESDWREEIERHLFNLETPTTKAWFMFYRKYYVVPSLIKEKKYDDLKWFRKTYKELSNKKVFKIINKTQKFKFKVFNLLWKFKLYSLIKLAL